ncbi:FAD/NAD(P)-binding protein [Streptantibioticus silvisoli]|uniref:FAD/NAD(P)-binding protein n=1 Tax=Streptantibioticus silvisoli TaxID=2705255 RepID=A0ABT6VSW8_9ACTN|nr:FAD/NAD(P)-binding protein [Streptantibioticus silvisoli]MDI5961554.1 FAD/NAD(P)-binding protein [Streptantibioticus silvisoli]
MTGQHHNIAVVGAGPRGTSLLERLCANLPELAADARLTVHVVDPYPPGAGQVWRTAQSAELLMNTVASQVTLFTDASVSCEGPVLPGPSLYEWAAARSIPLGPDEYPRRALYGRYLEWVYARVVAGAPGRATFVTHACRAVRLRELPGGAQALELEDGTTVAPLDAVALVQGHLPERPRPDQESTAAFAAVGGLRYLPPANPADVQEQLDRIAPDEPVLLRGLGLNFFDHLALLTSGRGGRFAPDADGTGLVYLPSGREPRLYAGSRRGVPYQARGDNAKGAHGRHLPLLLTPPVIAAFRARAAAGDPPDFRAEVWPLVAKEVEAVHYTAALAAGGARRAVVGAFRDAFTRTAHGGPAEDALLTAAGFGPGRRWDWERVARPYGERAFTGRADFRDWLLGVLGEDVAQARLGNVAGPVKAALDVLRDLRNELRQIVDHGGLDGVSRRDHLDRWYTPLNAFLSIGPPRRRIEELAALMRAGVVELLGPGLRVRTGAAPDGPAFLADSPVVPGAPVAVRTLVEARLPEPDLRRTADPLLAALLADGGCRPHRNGAYETGGLDVTGRPYHLIDRQGRPHARRFALGVPTEGVHWVTAAGARPGVDSVTLSDTDAVARAILGTLGRPAGAAAAIPSARASRENAVLSAPAGRIGV